MDRSAPPRSETQRNRRRFFKNTDTFMTERSSRLKEVQASDIPSRVSMGLVAIDLHGTLPTMEPPFSAQRDRASGRFHGSTVVPPTVQTISPSLPQERWGDLSNQKPSLLEPALCSTALEGSKIQPRTAHPSKWTCAIVNTRFLFLPQQLKALGSQPR